jgi:glutamyl-Q tRNA(Asp) synthetase
VRIEDLDPPREKPGAADDILATLERLGLHWDGPVLRQSTRSEAYEAALDLLAQGGHLRECHCSRATLSALPQNQRRAAGDELFHPAQCLPTAPDAAPGVALRLRVPDGEIEFVDRVQGRQSINVARTVGDFVLRRRDGLYAYQLAVVVDDAAQGITDVVRGVDLLASTPRQVVLREKLGLSAVTYMHVPLAVDARGLKLSKSEDAPRLAAASPEVQVLAALAFLGQDPLPELAGCTVDGIWEWGVSNWRPERLAGITACQVPEPAGCDQSQE